MNQRELIDALASETDETKAAVHRVLQALGRTIQDAVERGDSVPLPGVGRVTTAWRGPRVVRHIQTGRRTRIGGRHVPVFRPSSALKEGALSRTDQSWRTPDHQKAWRLAEALVGDLELYHGDATPTLSDDDPTAVRSACASALGEAWRKAEAAFENDVPASVRDQNDYLATIAFERWST